MTQIKRRCMRGCGVHAWCSRVWVQVPRTFKVACRRWPGRGARARARGQWRRKYGYRRCRSKVDTQSRGEREEDAQRWCAHQGSLERREGEVDDGDVQLLEKRKSTAPVVEEEDEVVRAAPPSDPRV